MTGPLDPTAIILFVLIAAPFLAAAWVADRIIRFRRRSRRRRL